MTSTDISLAPFLSRRYISMPRTASSFFSILDPALSSDGVKHPNGGFPYLTPENTASIPSLVGYWTQMDVPTEIRTWAIR
jgi:hypothetical protein